METQEKKNWLILGSSGLLGWNFLRYLLKENENVLGSFLSHKLDQEQTIHLDLFNNPQKVLDQANFRPDFIVNTIALTNVDECENDRSLADKLNIETVNICTQLCEYYSGAKLIQISTDQIHDGSIINFKEEDQPTPVNYYGETKLKGEEAALNYHNSLVCRSNFYGSGPSWRSSFSDWILNGLISNSQVNLFSDSTFNPLSAVHLCEIIYTLAQTRSQSGLFHTCGPESLSKLEFGKRLCRFFGLEEKYINPIKMADLSLKAKRPHHLSINVEKLEKALGHQIPGIEEGFKTLDQPNFK